MENNEASDHYLIKNIRWTARIISLLAIFLVFFLGIAEAMSDGQANRAPTPIINIFMGVLMLGGLAIAWKWEITGALISILGFIGVIIANPDAGTKPGMILFVLPAIFYLTSGFYTKIIQSKENTSSKINKD